MSRDEDVKIGLRAAGDAIRRLTLYTGVLDDPIGMTYRELVELLSPLAGGDLSGGGGEEQIFPPFPDGDAPAMLYRRLFALLAEEVEFAHEPMTGDAWQNHLLNRLLRDENAFSRKAETTGLAGVGKTVRATVEQDLHNLRFIYEFSGEILREAVSHRNASGGYLPLLTFFKPLNESEETDRTAAERALKAWFHAETEWATLMEPLADQIHTAGLGIFREFTAFRWEVRGGEGRLSGIGEPDPIHLEDLFAYERERELLIQNTEQFVAGYAANNVLLYGDRGTGKSSTVKALLHAYADLGLRMLEVQKEHLGDFPQILRLLRNRRERFVLFIDDLSFEEHETHYKDLKALLEGSLEARPANVVLYATSNRRHLVKERHSDRIHKLEDDEIHLNDTSEEKLSLSDRFGLTLTFVAPTQERYLAIIRGMAARRGITLPEGVLRARALTWATQRGGRSGRVARQFMDHLAGELGMRESGA